MPGSNLVPPPVIASTGELIAVAHALEREAARRYHELAARMRIQGQEDLATLFTFLAGLEEKHAQQVSERALATDGKRPLVQQIRWELPETFDEEDARSSMLTPYRALAIAVRNEERAFAFYAYAAAAAGSATVRRLAEALAKDELDHVGLLRRERRKAWHQERSKAEPPARLRPETVAELMAQAAPLERLAAMAHRDLAQNLAANQETRAAALFGHAAAEEDMLAAEMEHQIPPGTTTPLQPMAARSVRDGLRLLEYAFERYTDLTERATDEGVMLEAQKLATQALRRLAYVHGALDRQET